MPACPELMPVCTSITPALPEEPIVSMVYRGGPVSVVNEAVISKISAPMIISV
jgi:hypothetical protein